MQSDKEKVQDLSYRAERLNDQHHTFQQDVEDLVQAATDVLGLHGQPSGEAVKVVNQILLESSNLEAAFTDAVSLLDDSLALAISMDSRIDSLEKECARMKALAVFRDPIGVFRESVAEETPWLTWQKLAKALYLESHKDTQPVRAEVKAALQQMGLSISVWDDVRQVADAANKEFHQGKNFHPKVLKTMIKMGALPEDLQGCNASMTSMLDWLSGIM
ncbi:hypothetical protein ABBQ32_009783 [Trebouxia sp. C0010 RCD-2024]